MSIPTWEDDDALEDSPRPIRDGRERVFHGFNPRREQQMKWAPLVAAVAAGFLIALFGPCRRSDSQRERALADLQSQLESTQDRAAQLESELATTRESVEAPPDAPAQRTSHRAEAMEPAPAAEPAPKEERRELTPEEALSRNQPAANTEAASEPAPAVAPPAPTAVSTPSPEPPRAEPDQVAMAEPQGSVSLYEVPDPNAAAVRSISRSGTPGVSLPQVLTPQQAGWTTEAQPTLYWHASPGTQFPGEFTLTREGEEEPLLRGRLEAPDSAGIQRIELSQTKVSLEEGASYRWTISFGDPGNPEADRDVATGGIRRVAAPTALPTTTDTADVTQRLDALERAGLWYDAFDLLNRSIENNSGAKQLVARRSAMLSRVGIHIPSS